MSSFFRCAAFLIAGLSFSRPPAEGPKTWHVEIEALGQANPRSQGDEVWVYEVRTPQEVLDWTKIQQTSAEKWEFRSRVNAAGGSAALATGPGRRLFSAVLHGDSLTIKMIKHAWSGRVKVHVNGDIRVLDLYSAADPALVVESFGVAEPTPVAAPPVAVHSAPQALRPGNKKVQVLIVLALFLFLIVWTAWRRSGNAPIPDVKKRQKEWLVDPLKRLGVSGLIAAPLMPILARVIFGEPGAHLGTRAFILAFLYGLGLLFGLLSFWPLCKIYPIAYIGKSTAHSDRIFWISAVVVSAIVATVIVFVEEDGLNNQHAYWAKLLVHSSAPQPPPISIRYGEARDQVEALRWQPSNQTILTVRRVSTSPSFKSIQIDRLVSNDRPTNGDDIKVYGGICYKNVVTLAAPEGGMVRWPGVVRKLSFRISGRSERVRIYWLDQIQTVEVEPNPQVVSFDLHGSYQGWALLPSQEINSIFIEPSGIQTGVSLIEGDIFSKPHQKIRLAELPLKGRLRWPNFEALNIKRPIVLTAGWLCGFIIVLILLLCLFRVNMYLGWIMSRPSVVRALTDYSKNTTIQQVASFSMIAMPVWVACLLYHLMFVTSVNLGFTNDSVGYYDMARQFINAPYLQDIVVERTPGYPLFIAAVIWIFGDTIWGVVLLQHFALASLSLLTMWCLWDRLPHKWAAAAGLLTGIVPAVTPTANLLWTEALYSALSCSALLLASCYRRRSVYMLLGGACAGIATMLRPNGVLVLLAIAGSLTLHFFWQRNRYMVRFYTIAGALLVGGYLMVSAPWYLNLAINRHTLTLGKGLKEFGSWAGYVFQRQLPIDLAINRPDRAIYAYPAAYHDEPYVADAEFPLVKGEDTLYYRETERQWLASRSLAPYLEDLKYNATLVWHPIDLRFEFKEIRWFIEAWLKPDARVTAAGSETQRLLANLTNRRPVFFRFARVPCLKFSRFVLDHWVYLASLAGLGLLSSLIWKWTLSIAMFAAGSVLAFSTNLVPSERYIAVLEPVYYVLLVMGVYTLWILINVCVASRARQARSSGQTSG